MKNRFMKVAAVAGAVVIAAAVPTFAYQPGWVPASGDYDTSDIPADYFKKPVDENYDPNGINITYKKEGSVTNYIKTDSYKKYEDAPCWIWYQGYCYYYEGGDKYFKNGVTPDGYTVDEQGRWTENGVPVRDDFGVAKMGTEEYIGKSDDEIWSLMKNKLIDAYHDSIVPKDFNGLDASNNFLHIDQYAYGYGDNMVWSDKDMSTYGGYGEVQVTHNDRSYNTFVTAAFGDYWSDQEALYNNSISRAYYSHKPYIKEKTIKAVVGDIIGTELFNYVNEHANKILDYKNPLHLADGITPSQMDLSGWQNRTTDYGKRFSLAVEGESLKIHVYND